MNNVTKQDESAQPTPPVNPNRNPYTIWFVVLSFVAPAVFAYVMFFFVEVESFNNHGEILDPIVHIESFNLKTEDGSIIPTKELTYKWRLISFLSKDCDEACQSRIYDSRQVYTLLGKNRHRVMRMFVHLEPAGEALNALIEEYHPNVIHVYGDKDEIINGLGGNASITENEIYIMDPMGNVMMRFTQDQPNKEFLYDLRKLLKASQIG